MVSFGLLTEQSRQRGFFQVGRKEKASVVGNKPGQKKQSPPGRDEVQTMKSKYS